MLPTPDVGENSGENQRHFQCGGNGKKTAGFAPVFHYSH